MRTPPPSATPTSEERARCPYCAEWIMKDAIRCRYCGSDLRIPLPPQSNRAPQSDAQGRLAGEATVSSSWSPLHPQDPTPPIPWRDTSTGCIVLVSLLLLVGAGIGFAVGFGTIFYQGISALNAAGPVAALIQQPMPSIGGFFLLLGLLSITGKNNLPAALVFGLGAGLLLGFTVGCNYLLPAMGFTGGARFPP